MFVEIGTSLLGGAYAPPNSSFRVYGFPEVSRCNTVTSFTPFLRQVSR